MTETPRPNQRAPEGRALWWLSSAFWTLIAALSVTQEWHLIVMGRLASEGGRAVAWQAAFWLTLIPLTVVVWRRIIRWEAAGVLWPRLLWRHLGLLIATAAAQSSLALCVVVALFGWPRESLREIFIGQAQFLQVVIYAAIAVAGHAMVWYDRWRAGETKAAHLEAQLASVRLDALRAQLQPHFLFNSLNAVASLVRNGRSEEAVDLIASLSDLLRRVLDSCTEIVPIGDEISLVGRYCDVQRARFGDRLRTEIAIDSEAANVELPALTIQPLVENAIKHGLGPSRAGVCVRVKIRRDQTRLIVEVDDDGVGVPAGWQLETVPGTGLRNLRARLDALYGSRAELLVSPGAVGGFHVSMALPLGRA